METITVWSISVLMSILAKILGVFCAIDLPLWRSARKTIYKTLRSPKIPLPTMKTVALLLLVLSLSLLLGGCASNAEDQAFFETGWRHPGENEARMGR